MTFDFESLRNVLYSAVLSDVLDSFGRPNQVMKPFIRPLDDHLVLFGQARTGLYMNTYSVAEGENPYEIEIMLVDDLRLWCKRQDLARYDVGQAAGGVGMGKLMGGGQLFEGRHFDGEGIILAGSW